MSKKRAARSSNAFSLSTSSGVGGFGGFGTAPTFSSAASQSQLSYVTEPPDLSGISDASVVVLFKNLSKKDEMTKVKALEDLQAATEVEDPVLAAWVRLYPRLSTDCSRRVRALSQTVHGLISHRAGKKFARYMPQLVGPWLAGLYDNDRAASKAAKDALKLVFTSEEKIINVWRLYQAPIIEYCTDVIANETVGSLSDERQVSPDDAESKFARVIATCVLVLGHIISLLPEEELTKQHESYSTFISNSHVWSFSYHSDPYLRKALYKLLTLTLTGFPTLISPESLPTVSNAIIIKSLAISQIGSVIDYLDALIFLTSTLPSSWTSLKPSKKQTPIGLLVKFIKAGSQTAGPEYWGKVAKLISILPQEILPSTVSGMRVLLMGIIDGIRNGPEPRTHLVSAWGTYFNACYHLLELEKQDSDVSVYIVEEEIWPVYQHYILGDTDEAEKRRVPYYPAGICASGVAMAGARHERVVRIVKEGVWGKVEGLVVEAISRGEVKDVGQRWVDLSVEILGKTKEGNLVIGIVRESNMEFFFRCIETVVAGEGKPSDVTSLLGQILLNFGASILGVEKAQKAAISFFIGNVPDLLLSPSLPHLLSALIAYGTYTPDLTSFQTAWKKTVHTLLRSALSKDTKESSIIQLLKSTPLSLRSKVPLVPELEHYVGRKLETSLETDEVAGWKMMESAFHSSAVSEDSGMKMLMTLTSRLSLLGGDKSSKVCKHLRSVAEQSPGVLVGFARSENGVELLSRLLVLMESSDGDISAAARTINKVITTEGQTDKVMSSVVDIISKSVREPEDVELSLHILAEKARDLINRAPEDERVALVERLLFTQEHWDSALSPFLMNLRNKSLAITNPIGGAIFLIDDSESVTPSVVRDGQGVSATMRMGIFTVEFLKAMNLLDRSKDFSINIFSRISEEAWSTLIYFLALTLELARDNIAIIGANHLWAENLPEVEHEVLDFISDAQQFIANCLKRDGLAGYLSVVIDRLTEDSVERSTKAFYSARVLTWLITGLVDDQKIPLEKAQSWLKPCDVRRGVDAFRVAAILTGLSKLLQQTKDADRLRNELASDLIGVPASECGEEGLRKLIFLNAVLHKSDEDATPLPLQRTVFLIKHLLTWFDDEEFEANPNEAVISEATKTFTNILPRVKEVYGEHWQSLCELAGAGISSQAEIENFVPLIFASLELFQTLKSLRHENEDIEDAWNTTTLYVHLMDLLRSSRHPDVQHQPRNLCNALMAQQTSSIDLKYIEEPSEIYPLLNVDSKPVQNAAFEILHRYIPSVQEQVSIDAALSKEDNFTLQLPMELLSLVMEPPSIEQMEEWSFERSMPLALRGYLLTWILIFDHFENSTFKVKSAYIESLKEGGYLGSLLDFAFDFLGHAKGGSIDASKFKIESYTLGVEELPLRDTQWLLIHLYYLSLRFTPSLSKSWWINCKSRQKVLSVERFTEKFMSPLIIEKELNSVHTWIQEQPAPGPGEEEEMQVKITRGAVKEIVVLYPIDDQTVEIVVRLPSTFPLKQAEVEGVRRIGLSEKQFKRMRLASQAVINFQNASVTDSLTLFRKNMSLHLQGVAECAICYSVLGVTDRSLPNKACTTCRNKFHSSCLYKWFKTSNSSSCPLCRTSFSFYS